MERWTRTMAVKNEKNRDPTVPSCITECEPNDWSLNLLSYKNLIPLFFYFIRPTRMDPAFNFSATKWDYWVRQDRITLQSNDYKYTMFSLIPFNETLPSFAWFGTSTKLLGTIPHLHHSPRASYPSFLTSLTPGSWPCLQLHRENYERRTKPEEFLRVPSPPLLAGCWSPFPCRTPKTDPFTDAAFSPSVQSSTHQNGLLLEENGGSSKN